MALEVLDSLSKLPGEWSALAERACNPFATPEWLETWWRHFGDGREPAVGVQRDDSGALQAIVPLYLWRRRPTPTARFMGHGPGDILGAVHAPGDADAAARALAGTLSAAGCRLLLAERIPEGAPVPHGWRARTLLDEASPMLALDAGSWDEFLATRSSNFRQQVRRRERKLARAHELRFRLTDDVSTLHEDFTTLTRLHRARWADAERNRFAEGDAPFQLEFARLALERGWLRLWTMELDGRPVACWHGLRFAGVEWYYQAGRDPAFDSQAVGFVLLAHTVREAMADGMSAYSFLRGDEPYKDRYGPVPHTLHTSVAGSGAAGGAMSLAAAAASRLPGPVRRRLLG